MADKLIDAGIRVEVDERNEKVGYKIRAAQLEKVPYMLVVGEREMNSETVSVRDRSKGDLGAIGVSEFLDRITQEIADKSM